MKSNGFTVAGVLVLALAVVLFLPGASIAGPGGGGGHGGGGGGHGGGGGGHGGGGGGHSGGGGGWHGGGSSWNGGGGNWHGGNFHNGGGGYYPYYRNRYGWDGGFYPGYGIGFGYYPGYYGVYTPSYSSVYDEPYYPDSNVTYSTSSYTAPAPPAVAEDRAYMTIQLPVDTADVWIEGVKSVQEKPAQNYVSPQLEAGKKYYYEVRARWTDAKGKPVEAKRSFPIYAGKPVLVDFTEASAPPSQD